MQTISVVIERLDGRRRVAVTVPSRPEECLPESGIGRLRAKIEDLRGELVPLRRIAEQAATLARDAARADDRRGRAERADRRLLGHPARRDADEGQRDGEIAFRARALAEHAEALTREVDAVEGQIRDARIGLDALWRNVEALRAALAAAGERPVQPEPVRRLVGLVGDFNAV